MNSRRILSVLIVAVIISAAIVPSIGSASASSENTPQILIDYGNGETQWIDAASEGSYLDVTKESASAAGISLEANSSVTKINEFSNTVIKGSSGNSITTSWKLYVLDEAGNWKYDEKVTASSSYDGKTFAWGFYPDADEVICPVVTPQYPDAWTTIGGSSSSENVSDSYGPENLQISYSIRVFPVKDQPSYSRPFLMSIYANTGVPIIAVMAPTGNSIGIIAILATISANSISMAPIIMLAGIIRR